MLTPTEAVQQAITVLTSGQLSLVKTEALVYLGALIDQEMEDRLHNLQVFPAIDVYQQLSGIDHN